MLNNQRVSFYFHSKNVSLALFWSSLEDALLQMEEQVRVFQGVVDQRLQDALYPAFRRIPDGSMAFRWGGETDVVPRNVMWMLVITKFIKVG